MFLAGTVAKAGVPQQACFFPPEQDAPQPHQGLWHDWPQGPLPTSGLCLYAQQLLDSQVRLSRDTTCCEGPQQRVRTLYLSLHLPLPSVEDYQLSRSQDHRTPGRITWALNGDWPVGIFWAGDP